MGFVSRLAFQLVVDAAAVAIWNINYVLTVPPDFELLFLPFGFCSTYTHR
jgi:hypothetical protein